MKIIAIMPVRNEAWVLGLTARAALMWCDAIVLFLHACTDDSESIAHALEEEYGDRVYICCDIDKRWDEMRHRQEMLRVSRRMLATHIAIVDADEILTGNLNEPCHARALIGEMPHGRILQLPLYNLRGSLTSYHSNGIWGNRVIDLAFADDSRLRWEGDRFHSRKPTGYDLRPYKPISQGQGGVMHLWGCDEKRLHAKHRLYRVTERVRFPQRAVADIEREYSWAERGEPGHPSYGTPATWTYAETPAEWWAPYAHLMHHYKPDVPAWQDAEADRLIEQYGRGYFKGLSV